MKMSQVDFNKLKELSDDHIDYSDIPELTDEFWENAVLVIPKKRAVSLRLDENIITWFKKQGKGYQTKINKVLGEFVQAQQLKEVKKS